jgi:ankyrin repeat protein
VVQRNDFLRNKNRSAPFFSPESESSSAMSLAKAVEAGDVLRVRESLGKGESANDAARDGRTVLTWAAEFGSVPVIRALLEGGGDAAAKDRHGENALDRAVAAKRRNVVDLLAGQFPAKQIEGAIARLPYFRKAVVKATAKPGKKPKFEHPFVKLSLRAKQAETASEDEQALVKAAEDGKLKTVRQLLETGVNPEAAAAAMLGAATPLWAAINQERTEVIGLLASAGADLEDALPETPLFTQVEAGCAEVVRALAEGGADLNLVTWNGRTALRAAIEKRRSEILKDLLRLGADPNLVSTHNCPPRVQGFTPLHVASLQADEPSFEALVAAGATDPKPDALRLCLAAQGGDLESVKRLVESGVDVNGKDSLQRMPLVCAAETENINLARFLLDRGAKVNGAQASRWGVTTALGAATIMEHLKLVQLFVESGADLKVKAVQGMTALEYAKRAHIKKVAAYLQGVQAGRGGKVKLPGTKLRGVMTFDVNDACVLVDSGVEDVAKQFKKLVGASIWRKNVLGKSATMTERCYIVVRFVGIPWTVVGPATCPFNQYPSAGEAQSLSKSLKARAIHFANGDTAGVSQYALYDKGKLQEFFGHSSIWEDDDRSSLERQFGVGLSDFEDVQRTEQNVFVSRLRKVKLSTIKNDLDFVNDFMKGQNALVPVFVEMGGNAGDETEIVLDDFADDEIERADFVAIGG